MVDAEQPGRRSSGVNTNYNDTAKFTRITITRRARATICDRYTGNSTGAEPHQDRQRRRRHELHLRPSDITFMP